MKYASIVPLIGGETLAMENVFGKRPEYIMTFEGFQKSAPLDASFSIHKIKVLNSSKCVKIWAQKVQFLLLVDQYGRFWIKK